MYNFFSPIQITPQGWLKDQLTIQAKGLEYLAKVGKTLTPHLYAVPREIDEAVAAIKLRALGITIDALSEEQKAYMSKVE